MKLTIDGTLVEVDAGATVLDAVNRLGVPLPQLCKDPDRSPLGACRTCLVHVEGMRGLYERRLSARALETLPERPRFVFTATDLNFGAAWVFERDRVGSYRAGYVSPQAPEDAARWTVAGCGAVTRAPCGDG